MKVKGISNTAAYVAIKFYGLSRHPEISRFFSSEVLSYYEKLVDFLPGYLKGYYRWLDKPAIRNTLIRFEEFMLPGDLMHIVCRKFVIHELLDKMLPEFTQIIIPGSGFDHHTATLLSDHVSIFEIDKPEMIAFKKQFYSEYFPDINQKRLIGADLAINSLAEVLNHTSNFDSEAPTMVLAEGYWDYLNIESVKSNITDLNKSLTNYVMISTFFDLQELNLFHRLSFTGGVALVGESIKLPLDFESFKALLIQFDHTITKEMPYFRMKKEIVEQKFGLDLPVMKGFHILKSAYSSSS